MELFHVQALFVYWSPFLYEYPTPLRVLSSLSPFHESFYIIHVSKLFNSYMSLWALPIMKSLRGWYFHILDTLVWVCSENWVFSFMNPSFDRSFCFIVLSCPGTFPLWIVTIHGFRFLYRSYSYSIYCAIPIITWCSFINESFYNMESSPCIFSHHGTFLLRVLSYHRVLPSVSCQIRESFSV
jgi:hypothetical protein